MAILSESSRIKSTDSVSIYKLMNDASVDETTSTAVDTLLADSVTLVVEAAASTSGGVVTLEGAMTSDYTGTWVPLGTITTSAASKALALTIGEGTTLSSTDANQAGLPMPFIRARISTVISGGSVDVYLVVKN